MSPATVRELHDLVEELIAATDEHTYWLGPVRDTSLEIRELLAGHGGAASPDAEPVTANWKCPAPGCRFVAINPMRHPCPL